MGWEHREMAKRSAHQTSIGGKSTFGKTLTDIERQHHDRYEYYGSTKSEKKTSSMEVRKVVTKIESVYPVLKLRHPWNRKKTKEPIRL